MRNQALFDQLTAHDNVFLLGTWDVDGLTAETIRIYDDVLLASQNPSAVTARIADPDTHVVTLTITEKGYGLYFCRSDRHHPKHRHWSALCRDHRTGGCGWRTTYGHQLR